MTFFPQIVKTNARGAGGPGGVTASVFSAGFVPGETLPAALSARWGAAAASARGSQLVEAQPGVLLATARSPLPSSVRGRPHRTVPSEGTAQWLVDALWLTANPLGLSVLFDRNDRESTAKQLSDQVVSRTLKLGSARFLAEQCGLRGFLRRC